MFRRCHQISDRPIARPLPVPNCANVVPGFQAYSADKIGPNSVTINNDIFGKGKWDNVNIHQNQKCSYHEQNIYGRISDYYTPASLENEINSRVEVKLRQYEFNLQRRREQLKELLEREQKEQVQEIMSIVNRQKETELRDAVIRTKQLRARRESDRLEFVKEKKLQQMLENCEEFRPILQNRRLKETKEAQKMQIIEKQNLKQKDIEENNMWYRILVTEIEEQAEKEKKNNLERQRKFLADRDIWDTQCTKRGLEKQERIREIREEAIKLDNLKEEIRKYEIKKLDENRIKRNQCYRDIMSQIKEKQEALRLKIIEEKERQHKDDRLREEEIEKEKKLHEKERLNQEMQFYYDYIMRLDQERKEEEKRLDELIEQDVKEIQEQQIEARRKFDKARLALQKAVMEGRKEQLEHKKEEARQQLLLKQIENQKLQIAHEHNKRLKEDYERQKLIAVQQYREDLKDQIECRKLQQEKEKELIEKQLLQGKQEEEAYKRNLITILNSDLKISEVHPFRQVITREKIPCPKNLYY